MGADEVIGLHLLVERKALHVSRTENLPSRMFRPEASPESSCFVIRLNRGPNLPSIDVSFQCPPPVDNDSNSSRARTHCQGHVLALASSRPTEGNA